MYIHQAMSVCSNLCYVYRSYILEVGYVVVSLSTLSLSLTLSAIFHLLFKLKIIYLLSFPTTPSLGLDYQLIWITFVSVEFSKE